MEWSQLSKWIWMEADGQKDSYGEFTSEFSYTGGEAVVKISVDSNYVLYVNGMFVASEQYPDFPHYKVYDVIDITKFCHPGQNRVAILAWYYGVVFMTYYPGTAALRFEVTCDGKLCAFSGSDTLSRKSPAFQNGLCHVMTPQLGYGFCYDTTKEDDWVSQPEFGFSNSYIVEQNLPLHKRSIHKTFIKERVSSDCICQKENYYLYDIGCEEVGYLTFQVRSERKQTLRVCFGEHIDDGAVRKQIGEREFWVDIVVGEGVTNFTNYLKRFGCRYLEIHGEAPLIVDYLSLLPCLYPFNKLDKVFKNPLHQKIYNVGVRTLELCLHDHYEDCPWREQGLYAMDSRNQMLCGYYAFREYVVPRDNLFLMSQVDREDGLVSICIPTSFDFAIPSFSLHYITAVYEYTIHSGDLTLFEAILPKLKRMLKTFTDRMENGLLTNMFANKSPGYWNFYEWTEGLNGYGEEAKKKRYEAALNCLVSMALSNMQKLCDLLSVPADYGKMAVALNRKINAVFFDSEKGLYKNVPESDQYSELVNAFAILCGAATGERAEHICRILAGENDLTKISLSMSCFKYDALLQVDEAAYAPYVIQNLETVYKKMLDAGATSFWEDYDGADAFAKAGSLCHGWSAMPVYYFHRLENFM